MMPDIPSVIPLMKSPSCTAYMTSDRVGGAGEGENAESAETQNTNGWNTILSVSETSPTRRVYVP
jgi:hypothetical protein